MTSNYEFIDQTKFDRHDRGPNVCNVGVGRKEWGDGFMGPPCMHERRMMIFFI